MELQQTIVDGFIQLFRGRGDAYGSWDGGCIREELTRETFYNHLAEGPHIGVYPLVPFKGEWGCVWGCSDIDVDDLDAARNLQMAFSVKNIVSWVEKTRKGYHVWVFTDNLVPAATMRRAFLAAHQAINYPAIEVNPKQESAGSGFGNYVRLPYYGGLVAMPPNRFILKENNEPMPLDTFVDLAIHTMATREQLESIAELWKPPVSVRVVADTLAPHHVKSVLRKTDAISYVIWRDGPLEGQDRSSALVRLSKKLRDSGVEPMEAFVVLKSADERWGKFYMRHDGDKELIKIVERTYNIVFVEHSNQPVDNN
jgi:hypothetical protein